MPATPPPSAAVAPPRYGGIIKGRLTRDYTNWDNYHIAGAFSWFNQEHLSNLIRFKKDSLSVIEGDTAQSWDLAADGKTYTFKVRPGIVWSDGKPFTSADVIYNFKRASDPRFAFNKERVAPIDTIEATDASTVRITLKRPSASFLANAASAFMLMFPAHITDIAAWQKTPVGTGPFIFKDLNKGVSYTWVKKPNYHGKDSAGRSLPYLDGIDFQIVSDPALALAAFRTGRIHCGCGHDNDFLTTAETQLRREIPGVKLFTSFGAGHSILFNLQKPPFSNLAFRQAVAIGFDKTKIGSVFLDGKSFYPAPPLFPPEVGGQWGLPKAELAKIPGFNPDHSADLKIAQGKFKESGIDPTTVDLEAISVSFFNPFAELMATVLGELGFKFRGGPITNLADFNQRLADANFTLAHVSFGLSIDDPSDTYINYVVSSGSQNFGKWTNGRLDKLMADQDSELDPAKRRAMLWEVQQIQLTEVPMFPVFYAAAVFGTRPEVFNYRPPLLFETTAYRLDDVWLG